MRDGTGRPGCLALSGVCKGAAAGLLASAFLCGGSVSPAAAEVDMLRLAGLSALPDAALDDLRGGFFIGPFFINFGMKITTMVNDVRVLETSFNVVQPNQIGDVRTTVVQNLPSVVQGAGGSAGAGAGTPNPPTNTPPTAPSGGTEAPPSGSGGTLGLQDLSDGIQVDVGQGTRILQHLDNGVVTQILNSANGQTIRHATEMNLFITNFSAVIDMGKLHLGLNNLARESARLGLTFGQ